MKTLLKSKNLTLLAIAGLVAAGSASAMETKRVTVSSRDEAKLTGVSGMSFTTTYVDTWRDGDKLSSDGRYVIFAATPAAGSNLLPKGATASTTFPQVWMRDNLTKTVKLISAADKGAKGSSRTGKTIKGNAMAVDARNFPITVSADGRFVTFFSESELLIGNGGSATTNGTGAGGTDANGNLIPGLPSDLDTNFTGDIYVRDTLLQTTRRVSVGANGIQIPYGSQAAGGGDMSSDGRYIVFSTNYKIDVARDNNTGADCYVRDSLTGAVALYSTADPATWAQYGANYTKAGLLEAAGATNLCQISGDGQYLFYTNSAGINRQKLSTAMKFATGNAIAPADKTNTAYLAQTLAGTPGVAIQTYKPNANGTKVAYTNSGGSAYAELATFRWQDGATSGYVVGSSTAASVHHVTGNTVWTGASGKPIAISGNGDQVGFCTSTVPGTSTPFPNPLGLGDTGGWNAYKRDFRQADPKAATSADLGIVPLSVVSATSGLNPILGGGSYMGWNTGAGDICAAVFGSDLTGRYMLFQSNSNALGTNADADAFINDTYSSYNKPLGATESSVALLTPTVTVPSTVSSSADNVVNVTVTHPGTTLSSLGQSIPYASHGPIFTVHLSNGSFNTAYNMPTGCQKVTAQEAYCTQFSSLNYVDTVTGLGAGYGTTTTFNTAGRNEYIMDPNTSRTFAFHVLGTKVSLLNTGAYTPNQNSTNIANQFGIDVCVGAQNHAFYNECIQKGTGGKLVAATGLLDGSDPIIPIQ